jgi:hypothetical protein
MALLLKKLTNTIMDGGWVHPWAQTLRSLVSNFDETSLGK